MAAQKRYSSRDISVTSKLTTSKGNNICNCTSRCGLHRAENTQRLTNRKSIVYMEIIAVSSENHTKHKNMRLKSINLYC